MKWKVEELHPSIIKLLKLRNVVSQEEIEEFISDRPQRTYHPFLMQDLERGAEKILEFAKAGKKICIYGDYDADGVTSTALMLRFLRPLTDQVTYYIPSRIEEGYGLNLEALALLKSKGMDMVVTVDCGSVSANEVAFARDRGLEMVVTDHHRADESKNIDCIHINPGRSTCGYPFKKLAGAGVAFKLAQGIRIKAGLPRSAMAQLMDLAAIGTVGDIVPLIDENRTLVKYGLAELSKGRNQGLKRLMEKIGLEPEGIGAEQLSFAIVPHINAAGRMGAAKTGVELLTSEDERTIEKTVESLVISNGERKKAQEELFEQCVAIVDAESRVEDFKVIVPKGAHEGIAGIVAGKIKDKYARPTVIITANETTLKGTGRSIPSIDLYELLKGTDKLFERFGGHSGACGFSMAESNLPAFRKYIVEEMEKRRRERPEIFNREEIFDLDLSAKELSQEFVGQLEIFEPCGKNNEKPIFRVHNIKPENPTYLGEGKKHVRFEVKKPSWNSLTLPCILFGKAEEYVDFFENKLAADLYGSIELNRWNGRTNVQFKVSEMRGV